MTVLKRLKTNIERKIKEVNRVKKIESVKDWSKKHRKQIVVAGIATASLAGLLVGLSQRNAIQDTIIKAATKCEHKNFSDGVATDDILNSACDMCIDAGNNLASNTHNEGLNKNTIAVIEHLRNLPAGWHASQEKINKANERGIELLDNQTFVDAYMKGTKAA